MERRRQIGGGEKHTGSSKDDAKESLDMRILLRRVCAGQALVNLPRSEKFAKVIAGESLALVRTDDVGLELLIQPKLGSDIGDEGVKAASGGGSVHVVRGPDAPVAGAGVNGAEVDGVAVGKAGNERTGAIEVENGTRSRLPAVEVLVKRKSARAAANDCVADGDGGDCRISRKSVAVDRVGHTAPLVKVGKAEPAVENRLRSSRAKRRRLRRFRVLQAGSSR